MASMNARLELPMSGQEGYEKEESTAFKEVVVSENLQGEQQYFSVPSDVNQRSRQS